jgi:CheY-like chemotaxis protein
LALVVHVGDFSQSGGSLRRMAEASMGHVILVVDDEPLVGEITSAMLEDLGCEVKTATSGVSALRELEQFAF